MKEDNLLSLSVRYNPNYITFWKRKNCGDRKRPVVAMGCRPSRQAEERRPQHGGRAGRPPGRAGAHRQPQLPLLRAAHALALQQDPAHRFQGRQTSVFKMPRDSTDSRTGYIYNHLRISPTYTFLFLFMLHL